MPFELDLPNASVPSDATAPETHSFRAVSGKETHQKRSYSLLGEDLRNARRSLGLTQAALAFRAGCAVATVRQVETGGGMLGMLVRLSDLCGMEVGARALPAGQTLGGRLLSMRRRQRLGRRAAAGLAGLSPTTVAAIEGGADCQTAAAVRLAEALGAALRLGPIGAALSFWGGAATSSQYHGWTTPPEVLEVLYLVVGGEFGLDPCSPVRRGPSAPVRARLRFTSEDDGLGRPWRATSIYMNPPYGRQLGLWMAKARMEAEAGRAGLVIALVPARTDTRWWHDHVAGKADVWLLRGRLAFGDGTMAAPFPSAIVVWSALEEHRLALVAAFPDAWHVARGEAAGASIEKLATVS